MSPQRGRFITFEGVDGAGKSTHLGNFVERLRMAGKSVVVSREPGGTQLGERLRDLVLTEPMDLETETLLMFAARREHIVQVIAPALDRGEWVVCDRFTDATYAYQGGGRQLGSERIAVLERWVHPGLQPDLTLLFDLPLEVARQRLAYARDADRFEREGMAFFERTRESYLERAARYPDRFRLVDATLTPTQIQVVLQDIALSICN